jgi:N-acetylmuramoyl-L-alanine amidase
VREVIEQPGQFVTSSGTSPPAECYEAARAALGGEDPSNGALYFYSEPDGFMVGREVTARIGGHVFAR